MKLCKSSLVIFVCVIIIIEKDKAEPFSDELEEDIQEYCSPETFQPRCSSGEVILMKSAIYGRMRIGRCITQREIDSLSPDARSIGCSTDILELMDRKCSGKSECSLRILDISAEVTRPCFPDFLNMYLDTSYKCIKVADQTRSCSVDVSSTYVHINDWKTCGMRAQPWTVVAPIGQRIVVSKIILRTFLSKDEKVNQKCLNHVVIADKVAKINITECTSGSQREEQIYSSTGNVIDVYLKSSDHAINSESLKLTLKFQSIGCSDIIPPSDAYFKRQGETIVIGCYTSRKSWHLYCENGKWTGVIGNCSQGFSIESLESTPEHPQNLEFLSSEQVLWIVAIVGFTVALSLVVICFGAVFLKRRRLKSEQKRDYMYKTLKHQINPFANQLTLTQTENGAIFMPAVNETQYEATGQPTYSVFVGEDTFTEDKQQAFVNK